MTTPAASHLNDEARSSRIGIRSRILLAIFLASAPGIAFGVLEARRTLQSAVENDAAELAQAQDRTVAIVEQTIQDASRAALMLAAFPPVRDYSAGCADVFAATAPNASFAAAGRVGITGDVVCSNMGRERIPMAAEPEMARLRAGAQVTFTTLTTGRVSGEPVVIAAAPVWKAGRFDGAVFVSIRRSWIGLALDGAGAPDLAAFVYDAKGAVVAASIGADLDPARAALAAKAALGSSRNPIYSDALLAAARPLRSGLRIAIVRPERSVLISTRAALIALAPVIGVGLGMIAIWAALDAWVLRWIRALAERVRRGGSDPFHARTGRGVWAGRPPPEVHELADALESATAANLRLTRELHHRVKNNLQVLLSLIARQQKRAKAEATREALGQARARMLAIAIVHRFIDPPEDQGAIDLNAYLTDLCRQLVSALNPTGKRLRIDVDLAPDTLPIDVATVVGLLVAETTISLQTTRGPGAVHVSWMNAPRRLELRFSGAFLAADELLLRELARQAGGSAHFLENGFVVDWSARAIAPEQVTGAPA